MRLSHGRHRRVERCFHRRAVGNGRQDIRKRSFGNRIFTGKLWAADFEKGAALFNIAGDVREIIFRQSRAALIAVENDKVEA